MGISHRSEADYKLQANATVSGNSFFEQWLGTKMKKGTNILSTTWHRGLCSGPQHLLSYTHHNTCVTDGETEEIEQRGSMGKPDRPAVFVLWRVWSCMKYFCPLSFHYLIYEMLVLPWSLVFRKLNWGLTGQLFSRFPVPGGCWEDRKHHEEGWHLATVPWSSVQG